MAYLLGTDEAGYGPNLGPLAIAVSVWRVPDELRDWDLYAALAGAITSSGHPPPPPLTIADSKTLYHSGSGLAALELGVFTALALLGHTPRCWRELQQVLLVGEPSEREALPWGWQPQRPVPVEAAATTLDPTIAAVRQQCQEQQIQLTSVQAVLVFPERFNNLVEQLGSKGSLLSNLTLDLVARQLAQLDQGPILVQCDKHGGRNRYGAQLQQLFPEFLIEVREESRARSVYRCGPAGRRVEFRFSAKGEQFLPCALASMFAKYLRELAMLDFNQFWRGHLPALKPTAGYPVDARRFLAEIAECQARLGIPNRLLWRSR